jgi:Asp-tRNA(Asn)/Glu-tRNA(Gln) amidotransferase A subunit family amidase
MLRALDLAEALEAGDLSPAGVIELIAEAVAANEAGIKAFAHIDFAGLRAAANMPRPEGPLHGLPVAFKDIIDTADMPTEYGSPIYKGWQPKADATIVSMTRQAGGINLGKAASCEFAFLNPAPTRNPFDPARTPGGSSAGSAAGVAAGMMPLAFGTQTGGSVTRPASYCGVAAIKPSFRLLPMVGIKVGAWTLDTLGLFGARVVDIAYGMGAITGRDLRVDGRDSGAPTYGLTRLDFAGSADPEAEAALQLARRALEKAGAKVVDIDTPVEWAAGDAAHADIYYYEAALALGWERQQHADQLSPILREKLDEGAAINHERYDRARGLAKRARRAAPKAFEACDVLLTFSAPGIAPDRSSTGTATFNRLVTMLGLPSVNVPGYVSAGGMPVGVQVVAPFGDDRRALAAGDYLERALRNVV